MVKFKIFCKNSVFQDSRILLVTTAWISVQAERSTMNDYVGIPLLGFKLSFLNHMHRLYILYQFLSFYKC